MNTRFAKLVLFINGLVPVALLLWDFWRGHLGANPLEFVTRTTGMLTLIFLVLTLGISPLRRILGLYWLIKFRRMLGLFAFYYGTLHLLTYVAFDRFFRFSTIPADIAGRRFIAVGVAAFILLLPLAITSTAAMVKRLGGKGWALLHRLIYVAAILGVLHFYMLVKSDVRLPLSFAFLVAVLLGFRIFARYHQTRSRITADLNRSS